VKSLKSFKILLVFLCILLPIPIFAEEKVDLTQEEIEYIESHPVITYGVDPAFVPFEFIDSNGNYDGLASDYIDIISKRTGLNLVLVEDLTWSESYEKAVEGEINILPCISNIGNRSKYFLFSDAYYQFQRVIITQKDSSIKNFKDLYGHTVAIQSNSSHHSYLENFKEIKPSFYETASDAITAVAEGHEKAFVGNLATSSYIITKSGYSDLKYNSFKSDSVSTLHFAISSDDQILLSIINKGLRSITESEKIEIHNKWISIENNFDASGLIRILSLGGAIIIFAFIISFFWIIRLRKEIKHRQEVEEALRLAKLEAERANDVKSNFLARMSHEIRTPLNAITGLSYILNNTSLDKTQKSHLDKIRHASSIMLSIINDILDFSKIEAGKVSIESIPFDLDDVIKNVFNIISHKVEEKKLDITFSKDPKAPSYVIGDPKRLEQILLNLINNAVKFTESGQIILEISLIGHVKENYRIEFKVIDSGIGMSDDHLKKLFEPFSQEDASISRKYGGTGLGLSIVKNLTELMDGTINVESSLNLGSTFVIELPFVLDEDKILEIQTNSEYVKEIKTLVLSNDLHELSLIREYLKSFGIESEFTSSCENFLELINGTQTRKTKPYDLVIIDYQSLSAPINISQLLKDKTSLKAICLSPLNEELIEHDRLIQVNKPIFPSLLYNGVVDLFKYKMMANHMDKTVGACDTQVVGGSVLIVEDNKTNQLIAKSLLEVLDITIDLADNGQIACEKAKENDYDVILMDLHMPIMDGYEATKKILALKPDTDIIAMTADAIDGVKEKCHAYGMNHFISKPFDPEAFINEICQRLKKEVSHQEELIIDYKKGILLMGNNDKLYQQVLMAFYEENKDTLKDLDSAYLNQDLKGVRDIAHKVKGGAGSIGSDTVHQLASNLQEYAESDQYEEVKLMIEHFNVHFNELMNQIKEDYLS
jgi:signal transduction histidine kinase/DNA-binding response OmpR family regulator